MIQVYTKGNEGQKLVEEYGITELEAINILNGHRAYDYIAKYERIRTQTPLMIKEEKKETKKKNHIWCLMAFMIAGINFIWICSLW